MAMETKYYVIVENRQTKYLKTKISSTVIDFMLEEYKKFNSSLKNKEDYSFDKYLIMHGIECIYDPIDPHSLNLMITCDFPKSMF